MIMGFCTGLGMFFTLLGMGNPVISIGAILFLVLAKRQYSELREAHWHERLGQE